MNSRNFRKTTGTASTLLSEMSTDSQGEFSASIYETGRLVRHTPALRGHVRRVRFLLERQRKDGGWGGPEGYGLVPALSATDALLAVLRHLPDGCHYDEVADSVDRGLHALFLRLNTGNPPELPDTVAVEIIVPGLIADINEQLARLDREPISGFGGWSGGHRLVPPEGTNAALLESLRAAVIGGRRLPTKLLHSLEVIGGAAQDAPFVEPEHGCVGCSPAATAAWLGDRAVRGRRHPSVRYLEAVQHRGRGPVPVAAPLALFERAWVLSTLIGAGLTFPARHGLVRSLHAAFGPFGTAAGPGLPPDADDTATALCALARLGSPRSPDCLWSYRRGAHFACFPAERTPSTSTNAHVLQAFGACRTASERYLGAMAELTGWLCDRQADDGCWWDKWHASPYYATACCAAALADHGGEAAGPAVHRAVSWLLDTQRPDGSWGRWEGTQEETAYAVQTLLRTRTAHDTGVIGRAVSHGCAVLTWTDDGQEPPPLWHDKDLYAPVRIVRAERLAALHLARADPHRSPATRPPAACSCAAGSQP
jgi:Squalene-hopene cyclase C-terminal domain/Prenyltransferase and squalene oxidase repeat